MELNNPNTVNRFFSHMDSSPAAHWWFRADAA